MGHTIIIDDLDSSQIHFFKGQAKAVMPEEKTKDYYQWLATGDRSFDIAIQERILEPIKNGMLVGKFDDRKFRYSGHSVQDGVHQVFLGPTHFGEMNATTWALNEDEEKLQELMRRGLEDHGEIWAYFSHGIAANAVPVTSDGYVLAFKRGPNVKRPGWYHDLGGMIDTDFSEFEKEDPTYTINETIERVLRKEFVQEAGQGEIQLVRTGLVFDPFSTADFIYIAYLPVDLSTFLKMHKKAIDAIENEEVIALSGAQEVDNFLQSNKKICPTGRGAYEIYLKQSSQ